MIESPENSWIPKEKTSLKPCFTYPNADMETALDMVFYGCTLTKATKFGGVHLRRFFVDPKDASSLHWISPHKKRRSEIKFRDILSILIGKQSNKFKNSFL